MRGYDNDDGVADKGLVWSNELRLPAFSPLANSGSGLAGTLSPFVFVDLGHGYDFAAHDHATLASTGFGLDYAIGNHLSASFTGAAALSDAGRTQSGDWTFNASLRIAY